MIIPDARFEMPELLVPGAHPLGSVKVDWSHPLATGLTVCIVFQQGRLVDLVSGQVLSSSGGIVWDKGIPLFDEVDDYFALSNVVLNNNFSVLTHPNFTDNAGSFLQYFLSFGTVATANSFNAYSVESSSGLAPDTLSVVANSLIGGEFMSVSSLWPGKNNKPLAVTTASITGNVFIDGLSVSTGNFGTAGMTNGTKNTLYIGGRSDLAADRWFGGSLRYVYIYGATTLTPSAVASLARDPYQFLVPA
jgi:hypothetical protein